MQSGTSPRAPDSTAIVAVEEYDTQILSTKSSQSFFLSEKRIGPELFVTSFSRCLPLEHYANGKHREKEVSCIYSEQSKIGFNFQNGQGFFGHMHICKSFSLLLGWRIKQNFK